MCVPWTQMVFNIISFPLPVFFWGSSCKYLHGVWMVDVLGDRAVVSSRCSINLNFSFPVLSDLSVKYTETPHT